jgi:hypothetical protein
VNARGPFVCRTVYTIIAKTALVGRSEFLGCLPNRLVNGFDQRIKFGDIHGVVALFVLAKQK